MPNYMDGRIIGLLKPNNILFNLDVHTRKEMFQLVVEHCFPKATQDQKVSIIKSLIERENVGSTYIGQHFVIPRTRINFIEHSFYAFVKLNKSIKYNDNETIEYALFLFCKEEDCSFIKKNMPLLKEKVLNDKFLKNLKYFTNKDLIWKNICLLDWQTQTKLSKNQ